jgi:leucyl aminopeptidase
MLHFTLTKEFTSSEVLLVVFAQSEDLKDKLTALADFAGVESADLVANFKAEKKEIATIYPSKNMGESDAQNLAKSIKKIFLLGLGEPKKEQAISSETVRQVIRSFVHKHKATLPESMSIDMLQFSALTQIADNQQIEYVEAIAGGSLLAMYEIAKFKQEKPKSIAFSTVQIHLAAPEKAATGIAKANIVAAAQMRVFDMVNTPSNRFTPEDFAKTAEIIGQETEINVKVFRGNEVKEQNLAALWAVGKGSSNLPTFSILEYKPANALKTIGLVGKGVNFDTGGNNIKTQGMAAMKSDKAGAAAVLGVIEIIAKLRLPIHVICIVPACENMVDGNAYKPSDIIDSYSGYTIEVEDTDAEGRIILADGLAYLTKNYQTDYVFDIATLTGASIISLGLKAGAMFSKNDDFANKIYELGLQTEEKVWRMPLWDEYAESLKSDMADIKNYSTSHAGAVTAAKFLEKFTNQHPAWVHFDVAGMSWGDNEFSKGRSATAFGVRLMVAFAESLCL